jgi:hypothetical protein
MKEFALMSPWKFYQIARNMRKDLPKYHPKWGCRLSWEITRVFKDQDYNLETGEKDYSNPQLLRIDITGHRKWHLSKYNPACMKFDLLTGFLSLTWTESARYAELNPKAKGWKILTPS